MSNQECFFLGILEWLKLHTSRSGREEELFGIPSILHKVFSLLTCRRLLKNIVLLIIISFFHSCRNNLPNIWANLATARKCKPRSYG